MTSSCIYHGVVRHRRFTPASNEFSYRIAMVYLDLEEMEKCLNSVPLFGVDRRAIAAFHRSDHPGPPDVPLVEHIRREIQSKTGTRPEGPIRILTNLRYFGYCFNPVSFYYCFDREGKNLETIV
ncbi:MAG: DUF1365 family protein, partial [Candidatus Sumerlaeia bacterium]|nr:DUF1365 family protein [Candidatus Sumerlaeia bacterium]